MALIFEGRKIPVLLDCYPRLAFLDRIFSGRNRYFPSQHFGAIRAQCPLGGDMAVEGLAADAQFFTQGADAGVGMGHGGHGQAQFGRGHLEGPTAFSASGSGRGQTCLGALDNQIALEFGQGSKDAKDELAGCGGGVDGRTLAGQDFQAHALIGERMDGIDQMPHIAAQAIELPDHETVACSQGLKTRGQPGAIVPFARGLVFVEVLGQDTGFQQGVALQIEDLGAIGFRDPHVTQQHGSVLLTFVDGTECHETPRPSKLVLQPVTLSKLQNGLEGGSVANFSIVWLDWLVGGE